MAIQWLSGGPQVAHGEVLGWPESPGVLVERRHKTSVRKSRGAREGRWRLDASGVDEKPETH